ncbi:DUF5643 domain-containing protein [Tissierella sp. MB52-C2]|uniref:DUF5643 domain-containing protein n=1 Tax=Tissierella sp. MB52-C2 TaxID=3070999 RepID=UPI00280AA973|nr:DUF5643 domain-containing protein [Tissierella sp. MB52-C2]WMM26172.1 DUF5643 domain-containing protein [Tissierella sp. MB52-C2]
MKDSKDIYRLLNQVEFNIEDYEKKELEDMEKQNLKNNLKKSMKKRFNFKRFGATAAALILTVGILSQTSFGKIVYANAESKIAELSYSIGRALGTEKNIQPYANVVNEVVENNGVGIKLMDVIIDKDELILSTILNTNEPIEGVVFNKTIFIDGKKRETKGASGISGAIDDSNTIFSEIYFIDMEDIELKDDMDIRIVFDALNYFTGESEKKVKGKWEFEFRANGSELMDNTNALPLDYSFNIDNNKYTLEEFRYNPVSQKIYGKIDQKHKGDYDISLRGNDNLGNKVEFGISRMSDKDMVFKYQNIYGDLSDNLTSITLTPYAVKFPEESGRMNNDYKQVGEEFTIYLNR